MSAGGLTRLWPAHLSRLLRCSAPPVERPKYPAQDGLITVILLAVDAVLGVFSALFSSGVLW